MLRRFNGRPIFGRLIYRYSERSFDVEPLPDKRGIASLLVNDVQIEIDEDVRLIYVWGLYAHESWTPAKLSPPTAKLGSLRYIDRILVPGVSRRLNADNRWPVSYDASSRCLCVGEASGEDDAIAFAPGAIASLREGELIGLWLHPDIRD
jgi:hypothetical protein